MGIPIPIEFKVFTEAGFVQHPVGIATNQKHSPLIDDVVIVQREGLFAFRDTAFVDHRLSVVLAGRFQSVQFEESVGCRVESDVADLLFDLRIIDCDRAILHQSGVGKSRLFCQILKIVPVECATQAFAVEYRVGNQMLRHPPVGIDIRKIELTTRLEQAIGFPQHGLFIG